MGGKGRKQVWEYGEVEPQCSLIGKLSVGTGAGLQVPTGTQRRGDLAGKEGCQWKWLPAPEETQRDADSQGLCQHSQQWEGYAHRSWRPVTVSDTVREQGRAPRRSGFVKVMGSVLETLGLRCLRDSRWGTQWTVHV